MSPQYMMLSSNKEPFQPQILDFWMYTTLVCIANLSTFQLIARARRPHNIKFTFVHIEKFNLTFAQALIGTQFSVG